MCGDPRAPSVLFVLRVRPLRPMPLGAVSLPVWSFADWTGNWGRLRCLRAIPLEVPLLSTVITSPFFFTWVPLGNFLRLFKNSSDSMASGHTRASACSFVFFCLSFPQIPYRNRLFEPVATDYPKTDLVHTPVLIAYGGYLEPTE